MAKGDTPGSQATRIRNLSQREQRAKIRYLSQVRKPLRESGPSGHWLHLAPQRGARSKVRKAVTSQTGKVKLSGIVYPSPPHHLLAPLSSLPSLHIPAQTPYFRTKTSKLIPCDRHLPFLSSCFSSQPDGTNFRSAHATRSFMLPCFYQSIDLKSFHTR